MMLETANVPLPLDAGVPEADLDTFLRRSMAKHLKIPATKIGRVKLLRRSVDARKKANVHFVSTVAFDLTDDTLATKLLDSNRAKVHKPYEPLTCQPFAEKAPRPVVVGMGPAGLFCGLYLARAGARPLVVERGADADARTRAVEAFAAGGSLDVRTNVQFGEGGAGTFSDGKLTTNTKNPRIAHVLNWFVSAGAPEEILWQAHPHIGSDLLPGVVKTLRQEIEELGGEVRFLTQLTDVELSQGHVQQVELESVDGQRVWEPCRQLVLACGHSARDTFALVKSKGIYMERKPFSMGVRIEHLQSAVNQAQWGKAANHPALGAAEYKLVQHLKSGRSVYSFCMCPGGVVMASASQEGGVVTNGMSYFARDGKNANAALLVDVNPEDFGGEDVLAGVELQRQVEQAAFDAAVAAGGKPYQAPAQTVGSFLASAQAANGSAAGKGAVAGKSAVAASVFAAESAQALNKPTRVQPTYGPGVQWVDLRDVLPNFICEALAEGIPLLERKLAGFSDPAAVMTAPETRSSSPVRILRGADLQAFCGAQAGKDQPGGTGIYPCGEGPGYAGGIMSAAVDGLRVAEAVCLDNLK